MALNFGEKMARLRRAKKKKGGAKKRRRKAPKLSKRVARSAVAAARPNKRAKRAKGSRRNRSDNARITALEGRMERAERNIGGFAIFAGQVADAMGLDAPRIRGALPRGR